MFGVTTPCVTHARERLEARGYEVLTFHATGTGGRAMEGLMESGFLHGVLDITTTELCDELVGGVLSARAGPARGGRARSACRRSSRSARSTWSTSAPRETVPPQFEDRNLYVHNPSVTLMRTTPDECAELGRQIARKLSARDRPDRAVLAAQGVSMIDAEGQPFHDPDADDGAVRGAARGARRRTCELIEMDSEHQRPRVRATRWPTSSTST